MYIYTFWGGLAERFYIQGGSTSEYEPNRAEDLLTVFHSLCAREAMLLYSSKMPQIGKITSDGDSVRTLQVTPAHSVSSFKTTI